MLSTANLEIFVQCHDFNLSCFELNNFTPDTP